ncbi:hypothetical protein [Bacteroides reticulotermitis]|uniref:Outer membrane protein n=1 Tax=Bacteroides reticulotermitis JCM 10512 TaxID=1445607 RepID=W4UYW8_9BACE|nr:hypothetical protein JCM10512_4496 [Bacteroides reticulotermitis JCM 10512]
MKKYMLVFALGLLIAGLSSCDDGRIYENTSIVPREGRYSNYPVSSAASVNGLKATV